MTKTLTFGTDQQAQDRFQFLYQGFLLGAPAEGLKGIEVNRRAFRILEKLEAISEPVLAPPAEGQPPEPLFYATGDAVRALRDGGGTLTLEPAEVSMIEAHMETVPWRVQAVKAVVDATDFLTT